MALYQSVQPPMYQMLRPGDDVTNSTFFAVFRFETDQPAELVIGPLWARISLLLGGLMLLGSGIFFLLLGLLS